MSQAASTDTPALALPLMAAGQAQKHLTHNDALMLLDQLVQSVVQTAILQAPPVAADGSAYIPAPGATGEWAGHAGRIAWQQDGVWRFVSPKVGWRVYVVDTATYMVWDGSRWAGLARTGPTDQFGINATADSVNRLAVASEASLFTHAGAGHRLTVNRNTVADNASILFARSFVQQVEIGCTGSEDLSVRMRPTGGSWSTAMTIKTGTGHVGLGIDQPTIGSSGRVIHVHAAQTVDWAGAHFTTGASSGAFQGVLAGNVGGVACLWNYEATPLWLGTSSQARVVITADGNVGIGLMSPTTKLHVEGPIRPAGYTVSTLPPATTAGAGATVFVANESGGPVLAFSDGTAWRRVTDRAVVS